MRRNRKLAARLKTITLFISINRSTSFFSERQVEFPGSESDASSLIR